MRIIGPSTAKIINGNADAMEYTTSPCTPAIVEISGYVNRIPEPRARTYVLAAYLASRGGAKEEVSWKSGSHVPHASINLIE